MLFEKGSEEEYDRDRALNKNYVVRCAICGEIISDDDYNEFNMKLLKHVQKHKERGDWYEK